MSTWQIFALVVYAVGFCTTAIAVHGITSPRAAPMVIAKGRLVLPRRAPLLFAFVPLWPLFWIPNPIRSAVISWVIPYYCASCREHHDEEQHHTDDDPPEAT